MELNAHGEWSNGKCAIWTAISEIYAYIYFQAKDAGQRRKELVGEDDKISLEYAYSSSSGRDDSTLVV